MATVKQEIAEGVAEIFTEFDSLLKDFLIEYKEKTDPNAKKVYNRETGKYDYPNPQNIELRFKGIASDKVMYGVDKDTNQSYGQMKTEIIVNRGDYPELYDRLIPGIEIIETTGEASTVYKYENSMSDPADAHIMIICKRAT